jgi:peroxiredoxin Q/BCP
VLGVSYDTPETNRRFAAAHHLPFRLLSDRDRSLARAVGAAIPLLPFPKRASVLVGGDGRALKVYPSVKPAAHAAEVIADYRALRAAGSG